MSALSFFSSYGDHRDLHSFPTRRSSDLTVPTWRPDVTLKADLVEEVVRIIGVNNVPPAPLPRAPGAATDRKSTRLNSSHRTNSYAVFCLKKKNRAWTKHRRAGSRASAST